MVCLGCHNIFRWSSIYLHYNYIYIQYSECTAQCASIKTQSARCFCYLIIEHACRIKTTVTVCSQV